MSLPTYWHDRIKRNGFACLPYGRLAKLARKRARLVGTCDRLTLRSGAVVVGLVRLRHSLLIGTMELKETGSLALPAAAREARAQARSHCWYV